MFSSLGLFKQVDCPEASHCSLPSCIFSHHRSSTNSVVESTSPDGPTNARYEEPYKLDGPRKRRKLSDPGDDSAAIEPPVIADRPETPSSEAPSQRFYTPESEASKPRTSANASHTAVSRPISPPPLRGFKGGLSHDTSKAASNGTKDIKAKPKSALDASNSRPPAPFVPAETLNPRMVSNPPASHNIRFRLMTMVHDQMVRLNELAKRSDDPSKAALTLSSQELIRTALDEEQTAAKKNTSVYTNVLKLRIMALKKMELSTWKKERLKIIEAELAKVLPPKVQAPKVLETGLSSDEEIAFLSNLIAKQDGLAKHGYVTSQVSEADIKSAREGVESSNNWELCDRCRTRFQVFPGRRAEDGALTTGGSCCHHPSRARRPAPKDRADKSNRESVYLCCNEAVGRSAGCTTSSTHVFKVSEAKRLALIMPFEETPNNEALKVKRTAVCFDCEMGYTTNGMELIRLTATSWPSGSVLLDTLVRPLGEVLDLNSRYSGVWPEEFTSALASDTPSSPNVTNGEQKPLQIASSPVAARSLLFNLISPTTPLIGHALENDLNATRIIHPCIIDTCLLYPHVRGLPLRHGLKALMKKHLDKDIQINDEGQGHDSAEDARSAGELVRLKIRDMVKQNGKGNEGAGTKRSTVENGVDAVKRGMGSVGEILRRVS